MIRRLPKRTENFSIIPNEIINNPRLSARGLGLLIYILSKPDDWVVHISELAKRFGSDQIEGQTQKKAAIYEIIKEHTSLGYCDRVQIREDGRIRGYEYQYSESPYPELLETESPETELQDQESRDALLSTDSKQRTDCVPKTDCPEPENSDSWQDAPVRDFPTNIKNAFWNITRNEYLQLAELYPAVDIDQALREAKGWLLSNPTKCKTMKGMMRFLNNWLSRIQNRGGNRGQQPKQPPRNSNVYQRTQSELDELYPQPDAQPAERVVTGQILDD